MLNQYVDILTIDEVCEVLMVGRNRVYELLNADQIHGFKIGSVWKISKQALIEYITEKSSRKVS